MAISSTCLPATNKSSILIFLKGMCNNKSLVMRITSHDVIIQLIDYHNHNCTDGHWRVDSSTSVLFPDVVPVTADNR